MEHENIHAPPAHLPAVQRLAVMALTRVEKAAYAREWRRRHPEYMTDPCPRCGQPKHARAAVCRPCHVVLHRGENGPNWRGDTATAGAKRMRVRHYPLGMCQQCGAPATDRHHQDGNTGNNEPSNIKTLCRRCHMREDGRLAAFMKQAHRPKWGLRVTHCSRGHEYTPENTIQWAGGGRRCRICERVRSQARNKRGA